jgi:hypothetical protein
MFTKPAPAAKWYVRAGTRVYGHQLDMPVHGELVKCKRCDAILFGTFFRWHDHWHADHEDEVSWEEWLEITSSTDDDSE